MFFAEEARLELHCCAIVVGWLGTLRRASLTNRFLLAVYGGGAPGGETFCLEMLSLDAGQGFFAGVWALLWRPSQRVGARQCGGVPGAFGGSTGERGIVVIFRHIVRNPVRWSGYGARCARLDVFDERIWSQLKVLREHVEEIMRGLRAVEVARLTSYGYIKVALGVSKKPN